MDGQVLYNIIYTYIYIYRYISKYIKHVSFGGVPYFHPRHLHLHPRHTSVLQLHLAATLVVLVRNVKRIGPLFDSVQFPNKWLQMVDITYDYSLLHLITIVIGGYINNGL